MIHAPEVFRRRLNWFLAVVSSCFVISFALASVQWYRINDGLIETTFFPVAVDYTFVNWQQETDGTWSADVYANKIRTDCVYVKDQIETVVGVTPLGLAVEGAVVFEGDRSPGGNRPPGWQKLDRRWHIDDPAFVAGTEFRGAVLHQCHPGNPTVTTYGPFTVGVDSPAPAGKTIPKS